MVILCLYLDFPHILFKSVKRVTNSQTYAFNQSKYECNKKKNNKKLHGHSEFVVLTLEH